MNVYSKLANGWESKETWPDDSIRGSYRPMCLLGSNQLAIGIGNALTIWDVAKGRKVSESKDGHTRRIQDVLSVDDLGWIITAGEDRMIRVWQTFSVGDDTELRQPKKFGPFSADVRCLAYDPESKRLAAGFRDRQIKIWKLPDFEETQTIRGSNGMYGIAFDRDRNLVYGTGDGISMLDDDRDSPITRVPFDRVDGPPLARSLGELAAVPSRQPSANCNA